MAATMRNRRRVAPAHGVPMDIYDLRCGQESVGQGFIEISDPDARGRRVYQVSAERAYPRGYRYVTRTLVRERMFRTMREARAYLQMRAAKLPCKEKS